MKTKKKSLIEVGCIDCGHIITIGANKNKDKELREFGWEKKGDGWQCPHCYYNKEKEVKTMTKELNAKEIDLGDLTVDKRVDKRKLTLKDATEDVMITIEGLPEAIPDVPEGETVHFKIFVPVTKQKEL